MDFHSCDLNVKNQVWSSNKINLVLQFSRDEAKFNEFIKKERKRFRSHEDLDCVCPGVKV